MKLSVCFLGLLFSVAASAAPPVVIKMKSLSYDPKQAEVSKGQSVVWENAALTEHSAVSDAGPAAFDTGMVSPGKSSKAILFTAPGTYTYHCALHGHTMSGTIIVKAPVE